MAAPGAAAPRPLRGKSFYLDLPAGRSARELAEAIGRLGGALISRGKELLQKAMKKQDAGDGSGILASARLWGVQILHVDRILLRTLGWGCWELGIFETGGAEGMAQEKEEI
ncbi:hypothetical protein Q9966_015044 [Columba livia]|nr:hypothetical protein Q9966_015044 [Columba livia]